MKTYSLTEVAAQVLPTDWKEPELWLMRRLRRGVIGGYKVGHSWRMTQADLDDLVAKHRNGSTAERPRQPRQLSFTTRSRRRLKAVQ